MAQQGVQLDHEQLCCSICLDLLRDPVTVPCGHSYCRTCIEGYWNQYDQRGRFSCPQCRHAFTPRPVLKRNTMLAEVVESLKKTGLQAAPPDHCYAGPGDVACDVCTGRRLKAVKTCLQCLVSYCDTHLQPHYQSPAFKRHQLVQASGELQENICSRHNEVRKLFCRTDQRCICSLCSVEEHKGHHTTSAAAERAQRQKEVDRSQQNIQQRIQEREKDVKGLHQEVESIKQEGTNITEAVNRVDVSLKDSLLHHADHAVVQSPEARHPPTAPPRTTLRPPTSALLGAPRLVNLPLVSLSTPEEANVSETVNRGKKRKNKKKQVHLGQAVLSTPAEPKTRAEFLQYSRPITLDPNTANHYLSLSKGNRKVTRMNTPQSHPRHPERFTAWPQVLSREALSGRCYSEVERSGGCAIAVSHKDISRTGSEGGFGCNDKSWGLECSEQGSTFIHGSIGTPIPGRVSSRVGVYLDHSAGTLSFYGVSDDTMTVLHTVHTTFTHNLHVGLRLYGSGSTAELCELDHCCFVSRVFSCIPFLSACSVSL